MATQEAYVQVKDLKKHYGDGDARLTVLDGIDTSINRGEICVMLGPSGSGKSTFLNLIGGLEDADAGSILVDGCDLTVLKPTDLGEYRRRELGFVFQFYNLVPDLTIKENIEVTACLSKKPLNIDDLLRSLGLYEHRNKFPRQVSVSSNAVPSAARSSKTRVCCCATSPRARSTIRRPRKSCSSWRMSITSTDAPSSSSHTTPPSPAWPIACCACATGASSRMSSTSRPSRPPSSIGRRRHDTSRKTSPARAAPQYR